MSETIHPAVLLESLRWKEDMVITNCYGEHVWLGPYYNEEGKRIGITECCFEEFPCDWHKECAKATHKIVSDAPQPEEEAP